MAEGVRYIKIAKIDKDGVDQTTTLQSLTELTIPYSSGNITYDILTISEHPTHFVYYVENPNLEWADRADIEYDFTGSLTTSSLYLTTFSPKRVPITSAEKDSLGFYNSTTQQYILNTYPQKDIHFILTGSYSSTAITNIRILANPDPSNLNPTYGDLDIVASKEAVGIGVGQNIIITGSYTPTTPGTEFLILNTLNGAGFTNTSFTGSQLFITSSAPLGPSIETILEPYFEENFARSLDCQPTLNNVLSNRKSTTYQDIDYSSGQITPTNFELLINGSALKAEVQDSNYTLKRHTNPRYEGSRSTSQKLNTWSPSNTIPGYSDVGTYGKLPTIESLKTYVAYADAIGGYSPDKMNCSGIIIKYLIDQDGNVSIPNTTQNSLYNTQGTFLTGEKIRIDANALGSGETQYRNILKGGYRIEPILYTQVGHTPPSWTSSISLYNSEITQTITDNTSVSTLNTYSSVNTGQSILYTEYHIGQVTSPPVASSAGWSILYDAGNNRSTNFQYDVDNSTISEGVNLIIDAQIGIARYGSDPTPTTVQINLFKNNQFDIISTKFETLTPGQKKAITFYIELTPEVNFINTDEFFFGVSQISGPQEIIGSTTNLQVTSIDPPTYFNISQNPLPNPLQPVSVVANSIWNYPTSTLYNQESSSQAGIIYIPQITSSLNVYYNIPGIHQQDILGSGFEEITLDWSVEVGDEFRFEGKENRTYNVKKVFTPTDQSPERISNTGSVEVHLNSAIPSSSINLDHFLIRRYVDDASSIIFEGLKPGNAPGPYIITPEYVSPKLDKDIDQFILDLSQKGFL